MTRRVVRCRPCGPALHGLMEGRRVVLVVDRPPPRRRAIGPGRPLRWVAVLVGCLLVGGGC